MADCAVCRRPLPDTAYVDQRCADDLAGLLHDAAALWPQLQTTAAGQARLADPGPRARGHAPPQPIRPGLGDPDDDHQPGPPDGLPFRWTAAEVADAVRNTVTTWVRVFVQQRGGLVYSSATPELLRWLAGQLGWARYQPWAYECWDELGYACRLIAPAVDRPATRARIDVGPCPEITGDGQPCTGQVVAVVPANQNRPAYMQCQNCGTHWLTNQWARAGRRILQVKETQRPVTQSAAAGSEAKS